MSHKEDLARALYDGIIHGRDYPQSINPHVVFHTPGLRYWRWNPYSPFMRGCRDHTGTYYPVERSFKQ